MRLWCAAILLALAGPASASGEAVAGAGAASTPHVSAPHPAEALALPPASAGVAELLPPGARGPGAVASPTPAPRTDIQGEEIGSRPVVERIMRPQQGSAGRDWFEIEYTVDSQLDEEVRGVLKRGRVPLGHVIVMDPSDGALLSYVSTDPVAFSATRTYPTASLMKVVTAAAVLRHAPEAATRDCRYLGNPHRVGQKDLSPPRSGGRVDSFWRALAISNNQCFARLAVHDVGEEGMLEEMRRVGLLESPAAGHAAGHVEPIADALDLGHLGSGLDGSFISPLAAARLAGVLARGELVHPYWIARVTDADGLALALPPRGSPRSVWPPELAEELRELMVGVTARGTAKSAFRDARGRPLLGPVRVSGKTGSLSGRDPTGRYEWFIGVAPAEAPRVAIAAVVVNGPKWWRNASQIAAEVLRLIFCENGRCEASRAERLRAYRTREHGAEGARSNDSFAGNRHRMD
jgi:cell division protein FtsI/penicillin-binding protein 2